MVADPHTIKGVPSSTKLIKCMYSPLRDHVGSQYSSREAILPLLVVKVYVSSFCGFCNLWLTATESGRRVTSVGEKTLEPGTVET